MEVLFTIGTHIVAGLPAKPIKPITPIKTYTSKWEPLFPPKIYINL